MWNVLMLFHFLWIIDAFFSCSLLPHKFFVLTFVLKIQTRLSMYFYTYKRPIQYLLSKPFKKCETLSTSSHVHTRMKMSVWRSSSYNDISWLLYASLEKDEEVRGVKLLNNLILVPFFCIINLSLYCAVLYQQQEGR